jgi:phospholipid/cholesterol/gamma-HCH transport system permease protein
MSRRASGADGVLGWLTARTPRVAAALDSMGGFAALMARVGARLGHRPFELSALVAQVEAVGVRSISVTVLTAMFSCMVVALQFTVQMARFGAQDYVGEVVSVSQVRELGPVLTALIAGGRIGAGITAELGSMKVTEQIDAIRSMGADPVRELVIPRVLAGIVAMPILTMAANVVGIASAMVMARLQSGVAMARFYHASMRVVTGGDVVGGLCKAAFFGALIALIACHQGLGADGGTTGVGRATTRTVVLASLATLVSDFAFTKALLLLGA